MLLKKVLDLKSEWFITMDVDLAVPLIEEDNFLKKQLEMLRFFGSRV